MKRMRFGVLLLLAACVLSGCGKSEVELTNEQNDMIAEYIAGALLRYDMQYEEKLLYTSAEDEIEPEDEKTPLPAETEPPVSEPVEGLEPEDDYTGQIEEVSYTGLNETIGLDGVEIAYKDSDFYSSYPKKENDYFVIEAGVSKKLMVARFQLTNTSDETKKVDLSDAGISYLLKLGENEYKPLLTALPDDLRYLTTEIKAGKKKTVVVVFEVPKDASLREAEMIVSRDGVMAKIKSL